MRTNDDLSTFMKIESAPFQFAENYRARKKIVREKIVRMKKLQLKNGCQRNRGTQVCKKKLYLQLLKRNVQRRKGTLPSTKRSRSRSRSTSTSTSTSTNTNATKTQTLLCLLSRRRKHPQSHLHRFVFVVFRLCFFFNSKQTLWFFSFLFFFHRAQSHAWNWRSRLSHCLFVEILSLWNLRWQIH